MVQPDTILGDLMVGLRATDDKQRRRLHRVVGQAAGDDPDTIAGAAERRLRATDGHVRRAVTMATVSDEGNHSGCVASDAAGPMRR